MAKSKSKSLHQQLLKEIKGSPKKAAALGLLTLVGLYFWLPLAKQMFLGKAPTSPPPSTVAAGDAAVPLAPTEGVAPAPVVAADWREQARRLDAHATPGPDGVHTAPGTWRLPLALGPLGWLRLPGRDPFNEPVRTAALQAKPPEATLVVAPRPRVQLTAADLDLRLESTIVGPRQRVALINGRAYREGAVLPGPGGLELTVSRVGPRRVAMTYPGGEVELAIERPALTSGASGLSGAGANDGPRADRSAAEEGSPALSLPSGLPDDEEG